MGKKRKRKSSGKGFFGSIASFAVGTVKVTFKALPFLILFLTLGAGFWGIRQVLYADGGLTVQKITVEPSQGISLIQFEKIQNQILGKNILNVDLKSISANLEKDPSILSAHVIRRMPTEVRVEVTKRKPVAYIRFANQARLGVISEDGVILETVEAKNASGLIVETLGTSQTMPGIGQAYKNRGFFEAVEFLHAYLSLPMAQEEPITKIILDHLGNVSVVLREGPEVRLGRRPSQRIESFKKIGPLLESEMRKKIDYLDLQFDDVIVKQKKGVK